MKGLGTIANTVAVILGGIAGMMFGKKMTQNFQDSLMKANGVAVIFIGISGVLQYMMVVSEGKIETQGTMLLVFSLCIGAILGEFLDIEKRMEELGEFLKRKVNRKNDNLFVDGFVNTSLIICIGAMAIVGSMQDGLTGDASMLFVKAILDAVIVMINASIFGVGAVFSAVPIAIYQGGITALAAAFGNIVSDVLINELAYVGSALIFCVGINITFGKKIKVGNLLPALLIPIAYELIMGLI
ncbi:MAG: DUF554 domain-containing protein [Lachnospiraceae bacterium]|nr:DUF554 domain-containing protein [Robinsoniella sp.]MDY3767255.1 DUF554 domain-containing protein [Lachnospiraceae bacterium]